MNLTKPAVKEFQALYKAKFGQVIDYKTAELEASQLIALVSKIQPRNKLNMNMDITFKTDQSRIPKGIGDGQIH